MSVSNRRWFVDTDILLDIASGARKGFTIMRFFSILQQEKAM